MSYDLHAKFQHNSQDCAYLVITHHGYAGCDGPNQAGLASTGHELAGLFHKWGYAPASASHICDLLEDGYVEVYRMEWGLAALGIDTDAVHPVPLPNQEANFILHTILSAYNSELQD